MEDQAKFDGWARVEILGHQSHWGQVTTQAFGQAVLFRIDQPAIPGAEEVLTHTEWVRDTRAPAGSVIKRADIPAATVLVGSGSIYRIIPCDEATALKAIRTEQSRPLHVIKLANVDLLPAGQVVDDDGNDIFDDDDGNDHDDEGDQ